MKLVAIEIRNSRTVLFCEEKDFERDSQNYLKAKNVFIKNNIREGQITQDYKQYYASEINISPGDWPRYSIVDSDHFKNDTWINISYEQAIELFGNKVKEYSKNKMEELKDVIRSLPKENTLPKENKKAWWEFWK